MITAAEAFLANPNSHILADEINQIGYAIEDATRNGDYLLKWKFDDCITDADIIDIEIQLKRMGYNCNVLDPRTLTITW